MVGRGGPSGKFARVIKRTRMRVFAVMVALFGGVFVGAPSAAAQDFGKIFSDILHQRMPGDTQELTKGDVVSGLKEALEVGADRAGARLGARDGFYRNPEVQIPLPGVLGSTQKRLKSFGMSGPLDDLQMKINRGAEAAMPSARTLVVDAVRSLTIEDAIGVLRGGDTAATDLLRQKTELGLRQALAPYVEMTLDDVGAIDAVDSAITRYGAGLIETDGRAWLTEYAVDHALDGLFLQVAKEEKAIRDDPVRRTSDILRRVFGG